MNEKKYATPRGFFDRIGDEAERISEAQRVFFDQAKLYGAQELRIAPAGFPETYFSDTNLDPEKTYQLTDHSDRTIVLNCDSLPVVMRSYVASNRQRMARFMFSIPVFRYRNVQLRHYHHLGATFINDAVSERTETIIPTIMAETMRRITSKKINIILNEFRLWTALFEQFGFSQEDAKNYLFYRRFHHRKDKPMDDGLAALIERVHGHGELAPILVSLHAEEPKPFGQQRERIEAVVPECISAALRSYYDRIAALADLSGVASSTFNLNDYHSSEYFSGLGYQFYMEGEDKRIADGGSYHDYGNKFSPQIRSVYSGIIRHEDLLEQDDLLPRQSSLGVFIMTGRQTDADRIVRELREQGISVLEDCASKGIKQAVGMFQEQGVAQYIVLGDREMETGQLSIRDLRTKATFPVDTAELLLNPRAYVSQSSPTHE